MAIVQLLLSLLLTFCVTRSVALKSTRTVGWKLVAAVQLLVSVAMTSMCCVLIASTVIVLHSDSVGDVGRFTVSATADTTLAQDDLISRPTPSSSTATKNVPCSALPNRDRTACLATQQRCQFDIALHVVPTPGSSESGTGSTNGFRRDIMGLAVSALIGSVICLAGSLVPPGPSGAALALQPSVPDTLIFKKSQFAPDGPTRDQLKEMQVKHWKTAAAMRLEAKQHTEGSGPAKRPAQSASRPASRGKSPPADASSRLPARSGTAAPQAAVARWEGTDDVGVQTSLAPVDVRDPVMQKKMDMICRRVAAQPGGAEAGAANRLSWEDEVAQPGNDHGLGGWWPAGLGGATPAGPLYRNAGAETKLAMPADMVHRIDKIVTSVAMRRRDPSVQQQPAVAHDDDRKIEPVSPGIAQGGGEEASRPPITTMTSSGGPSEIPSTVHAVPVPALPLMPAFFPSKDDVVIVVTPH